MRMLARPRRFVWICLFALTTFTAADAAPITIGLSSETLGGPVLDGLSWELYPAGMPLTPGNVHSAASWDGSNLGQQWELNNATLDSVTPLYDVTIPGMGRTVGHLVTYTGATLVLKSDGGTAPWWNASDPGDHYDVNLTRYQMMVQTWFDPAGNFVNSTSTIEFQGTFVGHPGHSVHYGAASGVGLGFGPALPGDYPPLPGGTPAGAWGIVNNIRFEIAPEPSCVSLILIGLPALLARRLRRP